MDDAALVGVHGLHGKAAAGLAHLVANALCQHGQVIFTLIAVAGHIQAQLDVIAFQTVGHQACQIRQALHGLAAAADQSTQLLTIQTDDGGLALLYGAEGDIFHAHQGNDFLQVVHSGLDLGVLFDVDGNFRLLTLCGGVSSLLSRSGLLCHRGSGRLFGLGFLSGSFLHNRLHLRLHLLLHHGSGRGIGLFHAHTHLGGGGLQAQKTSFLGHFEHFIAHIQVVGLHAQQGAGFCAGFIDRLAGRFLSTDHNRQSSFLFSSSLSGTVRSSL